MKKFISVALATAMIASMGITAFAKDDDCYYDVSDIRLATGKENGFGVTNGDDELYFVLEMTKWDADAPVKQKANISDDGSATEVEYDQIEDIDDLKVNIKFTDGEEYVADYYIDEIDDADAGQWDGVYAVIVELEDNYTTKKQKIKGEITIKNKTKKLGDERDFSHNLEVVTLEVSEENQNEVNVIPEAEFDDEDVYINLVEFNSGSTYKTYTEKEVFAYTYGTPATTVYSYDGTTYYKDAACTEEAFIPGKDTTPEAGDVVVEGVWKWTNADLDGDDGNDDTVYAKAATVAADTVFFTDAACKAAATFAADTDKPTGAGTVEVAEVVEYTYTDGATGKEVTIYSNNGGTNYYTDKKCTAASTGHNDDTTAPTMTKGESQGKIDVESGSVTTKDYTVAKFTKDVENIELEDENGFYFDVKASDQGKLNLTYDNVAEKSVARIAPVDADLTFFNFYGYPEFDFTGKVTLTPEEDDVEYFVYSISKDGKISKINAKLNEDGDAYEFKTRTLGRYVLTDMELPVDELNEEDAVVDAPVADDAVVAPEVEDGKANPGTGC